MNAMIEQILPIEEVRQQIHRALELSDALGLQLVGCHLQMAVDLVNESATSFDSLDSD